MRHKLSRNPPSNNFPTYAQMVDDLVQGLTALDSSEVTG